MCQPCGAARALCQQQRIPRHLCHAVPWPSLQRARAGCCAVLLPAVLGCCLLACHAAHRHAMADHTPALLAAVCPTWRTCCCKCFGCWNQCLPGLTPRPASSNPSAACRVGRVCCRTCLTACFSWQASLWARRPRPTSLEGPRAPQALRAASLWMLALQQHPSQRWRQRHRHRRHRHRQQQQMAAAHPLDRLSPVWLQSLE